MAEAANFASLDGATDPVGHLTRPAGDAPCPADPEARKDAFPRVLDYKQHLD